MDEILVPLVVHKDGERVVVGQGVIQEDGACHGTCTNQDFFDARQPGEKYSICYTVNDKEKVLAEVSDEGLKIHRVSPLFEE